MTMRSPRRAGLVGPDARPTGAARPEAVTFFAVTFFAVTFFAVTFFAVTFFAVTFFAVTFFAVAFVPVFFFADTVYLPALMQPGPAR